MGWTFSIHAPYGSVYGVVIGELSIYNGNGQKVKSYTVDNRFGFILVDNSQLPSGIYCVKLITNGRASSAQKMLVIK